MAETASFTDPVFLARFGLARVNVLDYFLHPLNPFRSKANTSNEVLAMQGIGIGMLMAHGTAGEGPMSPMDAEEAYSKALSRLTGEQYQLLPPEQPPIIEPNQQPLTKQQLYTVPSPLYVLRHVLRTSTTSIKILGIYYVVEGVIYKSPAARSLMKTNIARCAVEGLAAASSALSECARFTPATGYVWVFETTDDSMDDPLLKKLTRKRKRTQRVNATGERTAAEEEKIRASEALDQILVRISKRIRNETKAVPKSPDAKAAPVPS